MTGNAERVAPRAICRHCNRAIHRPVIYGAWQHDDTGLVLCDLSGLDIALPQLIDGSVE